MQERGTKALDRKAPAGLRLSPAPSDKYLMVLDRAPAEKVQRDSLDRLAQKAQPKSRARLRFAGSLWLRGEGVGPSGV